MERVGGGGRGGENFRYLGRGSSMTWMSLLSENCGEGKDDGGKKRKGSTVRGEGHGLPNKRKKG